VTKPDLCGAATTYTTIPPAWALVCPRASVGVGLAGDWNLLWHIRAQAPMSFETPAAGPTAMESLPFDALGCATRRPRSTLHAVARSLL